MPEGRDGEQAPDAALAAPGAVHGQSGTHTVFISYASSDRAVADSVCAALERAGVKCWIAPRNVTPGEFYAETIAHAIDSAKVVVLVLSQSATVSQHVLREVERASSKRHLVVPFRIDLTPLPAGLEYFLNTSQWLDASTTGVNRALPRLVDAVRSALAQPTAAARVYSDPPVTTRASQRPSRVLVALAVISATVLGYVVVDKLWLSKRVDEQQSLVETTPAISEKSIAVLPFVNMSSDKEQEYFSDGLSEELLNLLAKIPELRVAARTSSFYFKGKDVKLPDIARELQVAHLLEGSVRKSGNRVRITAQLIRGADGYHQWSKTYDRTLEDVFAVQEEIAAAVVSQLRIALIGTPIKARRTTPEAHALYLQAFQLSFLGEGRFEESNALYRKALELDPDYAPAWIMLASNYINQADNGLRPLDEGMEEAREMFKKAIAIDPDYGLGHAGLGWLAISYDLDLAAAARHFERALALSPKDLYTLDTVAALNAALGRQETAISLAEYFVSRDPMHPGMYINLGFAYQEAGRYDDSIASFRTALRLSPEMRGAHGRIGDTLFLRGDYEGALNEYQSESQEAYRLSGLSSTHFVMGNKPESDAALAELIAKHSNWANVIAIVYALRQDRDRAFEWLEEAVKIRDSGLTTVSTSIWLKNLHDDPRWLPFLRKIGRAPEQLAAIKFELKVPKH